MKTKESQCPKQDTTDKMLNLFSLKDSAKHADGSAPQPSKKRATAAQLRIGAQRGLASNLQFRLSACPLLQSMLGPAVA